MVSESDFLRGTNKPHKGPKSGQRSQPVNPVAKIGPRSKTKVGKSTGRA
jgi:hypothetical protein